MEEDLSRLVGLVPVSIKAFFNTGSSVATGSKQTVDRASSTLNTSSILADGINQFYVWGTQKSCNKQIINKDCRLVINLKPLS